MDCSSSHGIDHNYNLFVETISLAIDIYIPRTSKTNKAKPSWWSKRLSVAICNKKRLFNKWKTTEISSEYQICAQLRNKNIIVKSMIRSAQSNYESRLIQHSQTNPKILYRYINSKQKNQSDITQLQKSDGTIILSDAEASEELYSFFFKSTITLEESSHTPTISTRISDTMSDINITEEIYTILQITLFEWKQGTSSFS